MKVTIMGCHHLLQRILCGLLQPTVRDEDMATIDLEIILALVTVNTEASVPADGEAKG